MARPCRFVLIFLFTAVIQVHACPRDRFQKWWFGPNCDFQCHCFDDKCDSTTGHCSSDRACDRGFFGPSCQYYSIGYRGLASQSNTERAASLAVDGYPTTCSLTAAEPLQSWRVRLTRPSWITWVDVHLPKDYGTRTISMYAMVLDEEKLFEGDKVWISSTLLRFRYAKPVNASSIALLADTKEYVRLSLCEVNIYSGRNIALHKSTTQTSIYNGHDSTLAVDGSQNANFAAGTCTHTAGCPDDLENASWTLMLGKTYQLYRVVVHNRGTNAERLDDFRVRVGREGMSGLMLVHQDRESPAARTTSIVMPANLTGNRINIKVFGDCRILTLCEVEVYGDCEDFRYGLECDSSCACRNSTEICDKVDGSCLSGCPDGFMGTDCKQECNPGTFGRGCQLLCSPNCENSLCDHVTGSCTCVPGWKGRNCTMPCDVGMYGSGCTESCTTCRDMRCLPSNGTCLNGCERGYIGSTCKTECSPETFGWGCNETCSSNCLNQECEGPTGACLQCIDGMDGRFCDKETEANYAVIGSIIAVLVVVILIAVIIVVIICHKRSRRKHRPDVIPEKVVYNNSQDKLVMYENTQVSRGDVDNDSDATDVPDNHVDVTMETDIEDVTLDKSKLIIDGKQKENSIPEAVVYSNMRITESHVIDVSDLLDQMHQWRQDCEILLDQFKSLPRELQDDIPHVVGHKQENKKKNRYKNITAYDHSRVVLELQPGDPHSDYINACHIKGYSKNEKFIASQGPTKKMIDDFVRMLWECQAPIVVMLTNVVEEGKRKCEQYWDPDEVLEIGEFTVEVLNSEERGHYIKRTLKITRQTSGESTSRTVTQYHFSAWPDKSVPVSPWSLIHFRNKVMSTDREKGPIVVHCSAGVGRTGTFIGLDTLLKMADEVGHVDVYDCVDRMRRDRVNMVQTLDQYVVLHEALALSATLPQPISNQEFWTNPLSDEAITAEYVKLSSFVGKDTDQEVDLKKAPLKMSESMTSLDDNVSRSSDSENSLGFLGSVYIPGSNRYREYMLLDTPDASTAGSFFHWMYDLETSLIVMLDQSDPAVWPEPGETKEFENCKIHCSEVKNQGPAVIKSLTYQEGDLKQEVVQVTCPAWVDSTNLCDSPQLVVSFIQVVKHLTSSKKRPTVVMSSPAYGNGGLFCCICSILDYADQEKMVSIPHLVSQVRAHKIEIIRSPAEYMLCYDCVRHHIETDSVYSNYTPPPQPSSDSNPGVQ